MLNKLKVVLLVLIFKLKTNRWLWFVLAIFIASRLIVLTAFHLAPQTIPRSDRYDWDTVTWTRPFARWDAGWYLTIARTGYTYEPGSTEYQSVAFFPLYPLLYFYPLIRQSHSPKTARIATSLLAFNPYSIFASVLYSEGLFIALLAGFLYYLQRKKWLGAGLMAGLASAVRIAGALLVIPLLAVMVAEVWKKKKLTWRLVVSLGMSECGLLWYMWYLHYNFGDYIAFFKAQSSWQRHFFNLTELVQTFKAELAMAPGLWQQSWSLLPRILDVWSVLVTMLLLALGVLLHLEREKLLLSVSLLLLYLVSSSNSFSSMGRYVFILLPLYEIVARILDGTYFRWFRYPLLVLSSAGLFLFSMLFAQWYWID